jgi:hypothetical protein
MPEPLDPAELQNLKRRTRCRHDFTCLGGGQRLCPALDFGLDGYVECTDPDRARLCEHSLAFGCSFLCRCPVRVDLCKRNGGPWA